MPIARVFALVLVTLPLAAAAALDLPKRKSGLWEMTIKREGNDKPQVLQMCIDRETDNMAMQMGESMLKQACEKKDIRREGNSIVSDSICKIGESKAISHSVFTGQFDEAYHGEIKTKYEPPFMGKQSHLTTIEAKWLSACKSGQKPGDMVMPNGVTINIRQMQSKP